MHEKNPKLWGALGSCLLVCCAPLGFYTSFISMKLFSSLRVGDSNRVDECVRKIKTCYKITGIVYVILIILSIIASFAD